MSILVNQASLKKASMGNKWEVSGTFTWSTYTTGGDSILASKLGLSQVESFEVNSEGGYLLDPELSATGVLVKAYIGSGSTPAGTISSVTAGTPAGTNGTSSVSAQTFTGTASPLNLASPTFSGTGLTAAGQVFTTTDNQTMTLNQCAGMWLLSATGATPPNLILSNTAVTGAPAVLTVQGSASTDAGAYKIVTTIPVGTNGTSTAAAQIFTGSALATHTHTFTGTAGTGSAGTQVTNGTSLAGLGAVEFTAVGL